MPSSTRTPLSATAATQIACTAASAKEAQPIKTPRIVPTRSLSSHELYPHIRLGTSFFRGFAKSKTVMSGLSQREIPVQKLR
jgi:hypothetical protein